MGFLGFYVKIITKPKVLEGFRLAREKKKCPLYLIFCKGLLKIDDVRTSCRSSKSVKKLLAKALVAEMFKKWWV